MEDFRGLNILYCEDDFEIRETISSIILHSFQDANITICPNGIEGVKKIQQQTFDLIISDFDMKTENGDGISLYKKLRRINTETLFVLFSGHSEGLFKEYIEADDNFLFLSKSGSFSNAIENHIKTNLKCSEVITIV
ncbi:MAG: response regulator [Bacteriovoracaceae bacterium]|jgi:CheY-like chemotaxis protein|nr:response regulator [Bacteriovoracaceae bacterium]